MNGMARDEEGVGWSWFEDAAPSTRPHTEDVTAAFARCLDSEDGVLVMAHLRHVTVERVLGPEVPATALRYLEGQRQLVGYMAELLKRGRGDK
ncbi:MAG: Bbp19 family protein [Alphaproteobacteria bacterium]|jgi:hypothetical protein